MLSWGLAAEKRSPGVKRRPAAADHQQVVIDPDPAADGAAACTRCGARRGADAWCTRCLERYDRVAEAEPQPEPELEPWLATPPVRAPRAYSRVKGGPMSFGPFGRIALSIVPVLLMFFALRNMLRSRSDLTFSYYLVMGAPAVVIGAAWLAVIWRRERVS